MNVQKQGSSYKKQDAGIKAQETISKVQDSNINKQV